MSGGIGAQEVPKRAKKRVVALPSDFVLTTTADQPDCPLEFTKSMLVLSLDGDPGEVAQIRNRSSKPIRSYTIAMLNTAGTGNIVERRGRGPDELLMPSQTSPRLGEGEEVEIVFLTDELRDKLKLRGPMQMVAVFIVVRVEFADGTTYSDEQTFAALQKYLERVGANIAINRE